jgi:hypothetical protein
VTIRPLIMITSHVDQVICGPTSKAPCKGNMSATHVVVEKAHGRERQFGGLGPFNCKSSLDMSGVTGDDLRSALEPSAELSRGELRWIFVSLATC